MNYISDALKFIAAGGIWVIPILLVAAVGVAFVKSVLFDTSVFGSGVGCPKRAAAMKKVSAAIPQLPLDANVRSALDLSLMVMVTS